MRVLFLTSHLPYPPYSGGRRREFELIRRIGKEVDLTIVAVSTSYDEDRSLASALLPYCRAVHVFPAQPESFADDSLDSGFSPKVWRNLSPEAAALVQLLITTAQVDLVHCEGYFMASLLSGIEWLPCLIVEQNIDHLLLEQEANFCQDRKTSCTYSKAAAVAAETARTFWRQSSACGVLTKEDETIVRALEPGVRTFVLPDGFDHLPDLPLEPDGTDGQILDQISPDAPVVLFVANFAYRPNIDATRFLVHEILPIVLANIPETITILAGNSPSDEILAYHNWRGIYVTGRVKSLSRFYNRANLAVVPVRVGGGVKVKILEALAHGKACITTEIGAQGLGEAIRGVIVRDEPSAFAEAICQYLVDKEARRRLEELSFSATCALLTWQDASDLLLRSYEEILGADVQMKASAARVNGWHGK